MSFLHHIRSQSKEAKSRYAFGIAGTITGVIALVWLSTLPSRFAAIPHATNESEEGQTEGLMELFDETKTQMGSVLQGIESAEEPPSIETANLDMLLSGEATVTSMEASSTQEEGVGSTSTIPTMDENTPEEPRTILIGTSTGAVGQ